MTGDKKYAECGAECFEKSLAGVRDCDDRYSFVGPGGPLRAGPSLGWHAVGYDLCYNGWNKAQREKYGRALTEYAEASSTNKESKKSTLEALAGGTMPPGSNHFGMQVGGASLALLAVSGEAFVNWPVELEERQPADVLPRCYVDSSCGFYVWRNREARLP